MLNRRNFFKTTGALALGSLLPPACLCGANATTEEGTAAAETDSAHQTQQDLAVSLQFFTVREQLDQDLQGTLQKISDIGYMNMESAAGAKCHYYGLKLKEFASMLAGMGMTLRSSHVLLRTQLPEEAPLPPEFLTLTNGLQQLVNMAAETGQPYLTCAYMFPSGHKTLDQYKRAIKLFNRAGEACKKAGLGFAYHNHDFEFRHWKGSGPMT